ncbi:MAG: TIGR00296 family protein [Candidatus Micrarchaeaceae archaeon]
MKVYSLEEGEKLVKMARYAIELHLKSPNFSKSIIERQIGEFNQRYGVFVTIEHYPTKELRGCIGFMKAAGPIKSSLVDAAVAAATEDPRFVPLSHRELNDVTIEVSILSEPKRITGTPEEIEKSIKIGRDGLIIEYGFYSGLLLPIVAVEQKWNAREFLENVCIKAGLHKESWKQPGVELYTFSTQVFRETEPNGSVIEINLD